MRVLYGVVGEGMGHAMRSAVVLEHLVKAGHDVRIVVSGRAADHLAARHPDRVVRIHGLTMVYEDNVVKKLKTALANLEGIAKLPENFRAYAEMARDFAPDLVISDFESLSYAFAKGQRVPIISVDNMQIIARCSHTREVIGDDAASFLLAKSLVKSKLPRCNAYLITTFFYPPLKKERTTLHPPILRDVIVKAKAEVRSGAHVLCYQSGSSHESLVAELEKVDAPFKIYGLRRDLQAPVTEKNLTYCPFSEEGFIRDLATARAVILGGGFTLMGEAVFLGKPMLSVPLVGQFEQTLNANYLAQLGYGEKAEHVTAEGVTAFLGRSRQYADNLSRFQHDANRGFFSRLDQAMAEAVAEGARGPR